MFKKKHAGSLFFHLVMIIISLITFYPILWLFGSSLTESSQVFVQSYSVLPKEFYFSNYINGWQGFGGVSFGRFFSNTVFITVTSTVGLVLSSSIVAFGLSRLRFKGRKLIFGSMIATMMLPYQVIMIPSYILFYKIGWVDTYLPLIIPNWLAYPFHTFLIMQFCKTIPREIDEAAAIDGCGNFTLFYRIVMPLLKPALVTAGIFAFFRNWNNFLGPLLYLTRVESFPLSLALRLFADPESLTDWGAMFAMQFLSLIPLFVIFLIFQKRIVGGISISGLKG